MELKKKKCRALNLIQISKTQKRNKAGFEIEMNDLQNSEKAVLTLTLFIQLFIYLFYLLNPKIIIIQIQEMSVERYGWWSQLPA